MSDTTEIRCWPSCLRAIDWSHDGIIALASDNQVELLVQSYEFRTISMHNNLFQFPNTKSSDVDRSTNIPQWAHFALQVPWFTKAELPPKDPAPTYTFSIGEEISTSFPIALSWSPPGLAKHRRCALAALTSNLVLSIWTSEGKVDEETSWDRRLIINNSLADYFSTMSNIESNITTSNKEKWRLRSRVRAFAWAPAMPTGGSDVEVGTRLEWGKHLVAVSNDDNHVVLLVINSPTSTFGRDDSWNAEVLDHFRPEQASNGTTLYPLTLDEIINQQRHITHVAWSPWITTREGLSSVLVYSTNDDIRARFINFSSNNISLGAEILYPIRIPLRFAGPMSWSPQISQDGSLTLAIFTAAELLCLHISAENASILNQTGCHLDGRWDSISGIAWDTQTDKSTRLHVSSLIGSTRYPTTAFELTLTGPKIISLPEWPYWREQIRGAQGHFSAHHDLKGNANAKVWGLSTSPLGDYIAACHTVHPTDMIEYGTPSDRKAIIAISSIWKKGDELRFPGIAVSAEAVFATARKWLDSNVESSDDLPKAKEDIWKKLCEVYALSGESPRQIGGLDDAVEMEALVKRFKQNVFLNQNMVKNRFEIFTNRICTPAESVELPRTLIAFRLAKALQQFPSSLFSAHEFSRAILESSSLVMRFVQSITTEKSTDCHTAEDLAVPVGADSDADPEHSPATDAPQHAVQPIFGNETCTFCDVQIPFTDLTSAACTNGHEFTRCGLSFLTIQAPGRTKYCGICNTRFFSDEYIFGQHVTEENMTLLQDEEVEEVGGDAAAVTQTEEMIEVQNGGNGRVSVIMVEEDMAMDTGNLLTVLDPMTDRAVHNANGTNGGQDKPIAGEKHQTNSIGNVSSPKKRKAKKAVSRHRELPVTLARVLYLACDTCLYCGGKFVG